MEFAVPRLLQHLLPPLLLGVGVQAALEPPARSWHRLLRKAPERPPPLAYPLVWTYCFLTLGYASYLLAKAQPTGAARGTGLLAHAAHFALLQSWQVVFLYCRDIRGGLRVMLALDVTVPVLLASYARVSPLAAVLLLPYLAWLFVLTYANWYMAEHNAGGGYDPKAAARAAHAAPRPASSTRPSFSSSSEDDSAPGPDLADPAAAAAATWDDDGDDVAVARAVRRRRRRCKDEAVIPESASSQPELIRAAAAAAAAARR